MTTGQGRGAAGLVMALVALAAWPANARADIVIEGTRWVETRVALSAGRYADHCERAHVVAEGETIESIVRAAYSDAARAAEVRRGNALAADAQPKPGDRLVLPAKTAAPADAAEPLAWEFWMLPAVGCLGEARRFLPGDLVRWQHQPFTLVALPVAKSADFAKLLREKAKESASEKLEAERPWLVVSRDHWSGKVVDVDSKAARGVATCTFEEVASPPAGGPRWTFTRKHEYFDASGAKVDGKVGAGSVDFGSGWPLVALSCFGALLLVARARRRAGARRWNWIAPALAVLLLAPAARGDVLSPGQRSVASCARLVLDETATAKGAPEWQLWRVGESGLKHAKRIEAGADLVRDSSWGFRVLALPADRAADFEALRRERERSRFDGTWEPSIPWLVVSDEIDLPKSVEVASPVMNLVTTYRLAATDPATSGGKAWRIEETAVEPFDEHGEPLTEAQASGALGRGGLAALGAIALAGALWTWRRRRHAPSAA